MAGFDEMTVAELKAEADRRELTVTRSDGQEGEPLRADYLAALTAAAAVAGDPQNDAAHDAEPVAFELTTPDDVDDEVTHVSVALGGGKVVELDASDGYETADPDEIAALDAHPAVARSDA